MRATFFVPGLPAPKGSRTIGQRKDGSRYTRESSKRAGPWVEAVTLFARTHGPPEGPLEPPYEIYLTFSLPLPARPKYGWPTKDGDLDKLVRGVLDGLTQGGLILDDRHVTKLSAEKRFLGSLALGCRVSIG